MNEWKAFTAWGKCDEKMAYRTRNNLSNMDIGHEYLVETNPEAQEFRLVRRKRVQTGQ